MAGCWHFLVAHEQLWGPSTSDKTTEQPRWTRTRTDHSATESECRQTEQCPHHPSWLIRVTAASLLTTTVASPWSSCLQIGVSTSELCSTFMNLLPRQLTGATSTPSLNPLTRMPTIPHSMFSLLAMSNKPTLLSYRCVPAGFWLNDNDGGKIIINNTFFFLSNCYNAGPLFPIQQPWNAAVSIIIQI